MRSIVAALAAGIASSIASPPARAHDYWLSAEPGVATPGERVTLHLWLGESLKPEEERPFQAERATRFARFGATGEAVSLPAKGGVPVWTEGLAASGGYLYVLDRNAAHLELAPDKFAEYLEHEGLAGILEERRRAGEQEKVGRERYTRYLKALVQVGTTRDAAHARIVDQALELRLLDHPMNAAETFRVELRFRGQPLADAALDALHATGSTVKRHTARTDGAGQAALSDLDEGTWLVRTVHMVRCEGCADADWESFWTSYWFQVPVEGTIKPPVARAGCAGCTVASIERRPAFVWLGLAAGAALALRRWGSSTRRGRAARRMPTADRRPR